MRDIRFVAEHRSGPLKKAQHIQLMAWACCCSEHVLNFGNTESAAQLKDILIIGEKWVNGTCTAGDATKAAVAAHALARTSSDPVDTYLARSVGHAVATAHMADHSLGAALYALVVIRLAGKTAEDEKIWQTAQLPVEIKELVISALLDKEKHFRLLK